MIGSLRGTLIDIGAGSVLLEVAGVGYRVAVTPDVLQLCKPGEQLFVYVHQRIREDSQDLYGFLALSDLDLFVQLLGISGVGPKAAMTILSLGTADVVRRAIMTGDLATLTSAPGVGKKTAQKIILDLKGQLIEAEQATGVDQDVQQALQSLGYSAMQIKDAIKQLPAELVDTTDRIREALKRLAKP